MVLQLLVAMVALVLIGNRLGLSTLVVVVVDVLTQELLVLVAMAVVAMVLTQVQTMVLLVLQTQVAAVVEVVRLQALLTEKMVEVVL